MTVRYSFRTEVVGILLGDVLADVAIRVWEPEGSELSVLCVHGFAGNGQDFEILAETLVKSGMTVIAPDIIGRGQSSFLGADQAYTLRNYIACISAAARFVKGKVCHLGTSWGGIVLLGYLATTGWRSQGLILNDIPLSSDANLENFRALLREEAIKSFGTREEAGEYVISSRSLDFLSEAHKKRLIDSRVMALGDSWRMRYDPAVAAPFSNSGTFSVVQTLQILHMPTLMTFGTHSPYVSNPELDLIARTNPNVAVLRDLDDPHPPSLMKISQILQVAGFLSQCFGASGPLAQV